MRVLDAFVRRVRRWPRLSAFLAGACATLSMPPVFAWPVLIPCLGVIVLLMPEGGGQTEMSWRGRAWRGGQAGWFFGFGYFVFGIYWISASLFVEAETFAWLLPFSATLIPAGLALFYGVATGISAVVWRPGFAGIVSLSAAFAAAEWLRGHVLTGLPWNMLGYALTGPWGLLQAASVLGAYGLTFWCVLLLAAPFAAYTARVEARSFIVASAVAAGTILAVSIAGWSRVPTAPVAILDGVRLRIVQPNISQDQKWRSENRRAIFDAYLDQSRRDAQGRIDNLAGISHLVWPESAIPFLLLQTPQALDEIALMLPPATHLVTGAIRVEEADASANPDVARRRVYNSILVLDAKARLASHFDKTHLVPFGEYLPLQGVLEKLGFQQLTKLRGGFSAGASTVRVMSIPGLPIVGPLICYEVIFPDEVVTGGMRPQLLLNVTNDGWFGRTAGPHQHLHQARVRAVEQGLPIVRAANTGISAVIDPYGRVLSRLPLGMKGTIDTAVPVEIVPPVYARLGDWVLVLELAGAMLVAAGLEMRRRAAALRP